MSLDSPDKGRTLVNLSEAVNAKTPRGKGASNRETARGKNRSK